MVHYATITLNTNSAPQTGYYIQLILCKVVLWFPICECKVSMFLYSAFFVALCSPLQCERKATSQSDSMMDIGCRTIFNSDHDILRSSTRKFFNEEVLPFHEKWVWWRLSKFRITQRVTIIHNFDILNQIYLWQTRIEKKVKLYTLDELIFEIGIAINFKMCFTLTKN